MRFLTCFPLTEKPMLLRETTKCVLLVKHMEGYEETNTYWVARYFHIHSPRGKGEKSFVSLKAVL